MRRIADSFPLPAGLNPTSAVAQPTAAAPDHQSQANSNRLSENHRSCAMETALRTQMQKILGNTTPQSFSNGLLGVGPNLGLEVDGRPSPSTGSLINNPGVGIRGVPTSPTTSQTATRADEDQQLNMPSTAVTMMSSGGVRKTDSGATVSFFVREAPDSLTASDWQALKNVEQPGKLKPTRVARSTLPDGSIPALRFDNLRQFIESDYCKNQQSTRGTIKSSVPGIVQRASELMYARGRGMAPNGWIYDQKKKSDGSYSVIGSRLYASMVPKNVAGTQIILPTREIELYELDHRYSPSTQQVIPAEIKNIKVFLPENNSTLPVGEAGSVVQKAVVNCHELGKDYLLYRAEIPPSGSEISPHRKRQLVIHAHGMSSYEKIKLPENIKVSFYGPQGQILLIPGSLALIPLDAKYSTHELKPASIDTNNHSLSHVTKHGETDVREYEPSDGRISDMFFSKFGSPVHDISSAGVQGARLLNNPAEAAAWTAHDHDVDVLTFRQAASQRKVQARFGEVLEQLRKSGLDSQYDEIQVVACRGYGFSSDPIYSIGNNFQT